MSSTGTSPTPVRRCKNCALHFSAVTGGAIKNDVHVTPSRVTLEHIEVQLRCKVACDRFATREQPAHSRNGKARSLPSRSRADVIYTIHLAVGPRNAIYTIHQTTCRSAHTTPSANPMMARITAGPDSVLELTASATGCGNRLPTHTALNVRHTRPPMPTHAREW